MRSAQPQKQKTKEHLWVFWKSHAILPSRTGTTPLCGLSAGSLFILQSKGYGTHSSFADGLRRDHCEPAGFRNCGGRRNHPHSLRLRHCKRIFPLVLFIGIGAMIDFGPVLTNPKLMLFGAAAQFGIFSRSAWQPSAGSGRWNPLPLR